LDCRLSDLLGILPISLRASGIGAMIAPLLVDIVAVRSIPSALLLLSGFWLLGTGAMPPRRWPGGFEAKDLQLERIAWIGNAAGV
jgi:hypothetical protein